MTRSKKILVFAHYSELYGANNSLLNFLEHSRFPKSDFVVMVSLLGSFTDKLNELGISYILQNFSNNTYSEAQHIFRRNWNAIKKVRWLYHLYRTVRKIQPCLIYSNSSVMYYGFLLGKLLNIPHVWHLREFGALDYKAYPDFGRKFQQYLLRKNDFNIAISKSIYEYYNLKPENAEVVYNGIASSSQLLETFKERDYQGPLSFGIVGEIIPYKAQLKVVEAFHQYLVLKDSKDDLLYLTGVGSGAYLAEINEYITVNQLQNNVIIEGHVADRAQIYEKYDMLIVGAANEGFGRAAVEAMTYGVIPIGLNGSGTAEIIKPGVTGLLFDNFQELPKILLGLHNDSVALQTLQQSIRKNFDERFLTSTYCDTLDHILNKLLSNNQTSTLRN